MRNLRLKLHMLAGFMTCVLASAFAVYAIRHGLDALTLAVCGGCCLAFCLCLWQCIVSLETPAPVYVNSDYMDTRHMMPVISICAGFVLILHLLLALGIWSRYPGLSIIQAFTTDLMNDIDVRNFQQLAEYWYPAGIQLPLFAALVRAFALTSKFLPTAIAINALCAIGSGVYVYRLTLLDYDHKTALRAVKYMYIFPAGFFFALPISGGMFFPILFMYLIRKRYYVFAAIAGFCAALGTNCGPLMLIPALLEAVNEYRGDMNENRTFPRILLTVLPVAGVLCGLGCYFYINYLYYGSAFVFLTRQHMYFEHTSWSFWDTAAYLFTQTKAWLISAPEIAYAVSIPNLVCMFVILLLLSAGTKKIRLSYVFYGVVWFILYFAILADLNAPRYTVGLFPLAIVSAVITRSKLADIFFTMLYIAGFAAYFRFSVC